VICSLDRFLVSGLLLFSSCMNFSHLEIKSRSDSLGLGFGTGIKNHQKIYFHKVWLQFVHLKSWVGPSLALELTIFL
jgi:hypothetical protein